MAQSNSDTPSSPRPLSTHTDRIVAIIETCASDANLIRHVGDEFNIAPPPVVRDVAEALQVASTMVTTFHSKHPSTNPVALPPTLPPAIESAISAFQDVREAIHPLRRQAEHAEQSEWNTMGYSGQALGETFSNMLWSLFSVTVQSYYSSSRNRAAFGRVLSLVRDATARLDAVLRMLDAHLRATASRTVAKSPVLTSAMQAISAASPSPPTTHSTLPARGYDVFISHCGVEKQTMAIPLFDALQRRGYSSFVDMASLEPGSDGVKTIKHAIDNSRVALFVLSPEFAARKWPMMELKLFLAREEKTNKPDSGSEPLVMIPLFYRLTAEQCKDGAVFNIDNAAKQKVFYNEGFHQRVAVGEASYEEVRRLLKKIASFVGILNTENASNENFQQMRARRMALIEKTADVIDSVLKTKLRNSD